MKIGLQTWGTDGDFYPFLALAIGLKAVGHEVTLAYTSVDGKDYSDHPLSEGIELIKADGGIPIPKDVNPYAIDAKAGSFKEYSKLLDLYFDPFVEVMYEASEQLCSEDELVIGHAACITLHTAALKHKRPRISLILTPMMLQSKEFSPLGTDLGLWINTMMWWLGDRVSTARWFRSAQAIHHKEGLPRIKSLQHEMFRSPLLTLVAANSSLCPRPSDWPFNVKMTGFLNLKSTEKQWSMPEDLRVFLQADEAPIYMTFGSCMAFDVEVSTRLLLEAAKRSGRRAIIQSNWGALNRSDNPNIFQIGQAPHSELFPHCSLIVHHGGAGTTQAALMAGKPSVVVAHGFDQPYWGGQLKTANAGGRVLNRKGLMAEALAAEIDAVGSDHKLTSNAQRISSEMQQDNGVTFTVDAIQELLVQLSEQVDNLNDKKQR